MKKIFSFKTRQENIYKLQNDEFDILIIGGGINGAGVARDAASRGMKVALVEARDYAFGTSSRSSKLIHGGIRYLENLEFKLVFEALAEREKLFSIAPHLVHPLRFIIPIYKKSRVGMFKMGLGMWLYDLLALFRAPQMHEKLSPYQTLERSPILNVNELCGSYVYSDAYMDDDRLTIETIRSAHDLGAVCVSYVKATGAKFQSSEMAQIKCTDVLSKKEFTVKAKHVVSTVGPWTDELGHQLFADWRDILRPTKGVHLTFHRKRLDIEEAVVMAVEKRIVFVIPREEMTIVGTTDTDFSGPPEKVSCTSSDVKYLLGVIDEYFPNARITEKDIVASYAGVRPLVKDNAESEGKTSREHSIFTDPRGVTFVAGGKYTTYRLIAQEVMEEVLDHFSVEDQARYARGSTEIPVNPDITVDTLVEARYKIPEYEAQTGMREDEIEYLISRYGLEVEKVFSFLSPAHGVWEMEAFFAIHHSMCLNLVDFYFRRTSLFLSRVGHGLEYINAVAHVFAQELGWSDEQLSKQKQYLHDVIDQEQDWRN